MVQASDACPLPNSEHRYSAPYLAYCQGTFTLLDAMDPSFPYDRQLAQMAIEQRKHEFCRFLEQSLVGPAGLFQMTSSNTSTQPHYPGPVVENGLAFRSNPAPALRMEGHQTGFINPWGNMPEPFDYSNSSLTHTSVPDDALLASLFPVPHNTNTNVSSLIASTTRTRQLSSHAPGRTAYNDLTSWQSPSAASSFPSQHHFRRPPTHLWPSQGPRHSARESPITSQSPPISISSKQSSFPSCASMSPAPTVSGADYASPRLSVGESDQEQNGGQPYSRLIWEALMSTEGKMLPLQGIYQWFEQNTDKGKNEELKGWQNSIRHNLSMNAGFEAIKVEIPGKKAVNYWRLTEDAIRDGVQSTTRYRKMSAKKATSSDPPDPRHQRPGSRGRKKTAGVKRQAPEDEQDGEPDRPQSTAFQRNVRQHRSPPFLASSRLQPDAEQSLSIDANIGHIERWNSQYMPASSITAPQYPEPYMPDNSLPQMPRSYWHHFDLSSVIGTTSPPDGNNMIFCDTAEGAPDCPAFVGPWHPRVGTTKSQGPITMDR